MVVSISAKWANINYYKQGNPEKITSCNLYHKKF